MGALLLDSINQPRDLKQLNEQQVKQLCAEIRQFLLENISRTSRRSCLKPWRGRAYCCAAPCSGYTTVQNRV